jgi:ABC-type Fe3+-hydroxamate transport system substrate-binding protein
MPVYTDQLQRSITLEKIPQRIISLVPSQTELLFDLGLDENVVGITKFCIHPNKWFRTKTRIGGTKNININTIHSLKPDLIIGNKEENVKEQIEELSTELPVWMSDVNNLDDALSMIQSIGEITGKEDKALHISADIKQGFEKLSEHRFKLPITVAYLIWKDPLIAVGGNTFIDDMLFRCGFRNVFKHIARYPEIDVQQIRDADCEFLFLSSEPYPFKEPHANSLGEALPSTNIILVDGEMFSWYGSRLTTAATYFENLIDEIGGGMKIVK